MKLARLFVLTPALLLLNFSFGPAELSSAERKHAIDYLTQTRDALKESVKGLSKEQLNFKPSPEAWSVSECVEHLALAEARLYKGIQGSLKEEANPAKRSEIKFSDDGIFNAISERTHKVKTFEALVPSNKFGSTEAALSEFEKERQTTIDFVKNTKDDLRNHFYGFPPEAFGTVDTYQLVLFVAGHSKRHTAQIEEVKANPAFPKK